MYQHPIIDMNTEAGHLGREVQTWPTSVFAAVLLHRFRRGERVDVPAAPPSQTLGSTDPSNQLAWKEWAAALDRAADRGAYPWR